MGSREAASLAANTATTPMVVAVDVIGEHAAGAAAAPELERVEIDVDVVPRLTTVEMLVADVAAALEEMQLRMCVPEASAALAPGNVLPALGTLQHALKQRADARETRGELHGIEDRYTGALRQAQATAEGGASRASSSAAPPPANLQLRAGSAYVMDRADAAAASAAGAPPSTTWCIVPRSLLPAAVAAARHDGAAYAGRATVQTSSLLVLTRPGASVVTGAAVSGEPAAADEAAADGEAVPTATTPPSSYRSGVADALLGSQATTASAGQPRPGAHSLASSQGAGSLGASPATAPELAPPSDAPVVALEDVDVVAFRRLQAHHTEMLVREARDYGGAAAAEVSAEQRRLAPTLSWAAVEAAVQAEVDRLRAENVLTHGGSADGDGDDAADERVTASSATPRGRSPAGSAAPSPPLLHAQWLAAAAAETQSYRSETAVLRRATEKARQWRESTKAQLRAEVAQLEEEAAQHKVAVSQRDVLRRRVEQLEAEVAAAKAAETALLMTAKSALTVATATAPPPPPAAVAATSGNANGRASEEPPTGSSRSSSAASSSSSDTPPPPAPPPPQAYAEERGGGAAGHGRAGRRVPLRQVYDAARATGEASVDARYAAAAAPDHLGSRTSIERSFLSPSLQAEVAAALASDEDADAPAAPHEGARDSRHGLYHERAAATAAASEAYAEAAVSRPAPAHEPRRRRQRSGVPAAPVVAATAAAAPPVTPLRTAPTTSSSPYPSIPAPAHALRHAYLQGEDTPAPEAVEKLRHVTAALRRHIRAPQPDPREGQRLLQQVRALRAQIESEGSGDQLMDDSDTPEAAAFSEYRNRSPYRPHAPRDAPAAAAAVPVSRRSLTDRGFASAVLGYSEATSMTVDRSRVQEGGVRRSPSVDSPSSRSLGHGHLRPTWYNSGSTSYGG